MSGFGSLDQSCCPDGFLFQKLDDCVIYYNLYVSDSLPQVGESIIIDTELHVKLFYKGSPIPLPNWFRQRHSCKLYSLSTLHNLPSYNNNRVSEMSSELLDEMAEIQYLKPKGRPPFTHLE